MNTVVLTGYTSSALDKPALSATADQIHMGQLMEIVHHLKNINNILGDKIKYLAKKNAILERKGQDEKNRPTKMKVTLQNWIRTGIVGIMVGGSPRVIAIDLLK